MLQGKVRDTYELDDKLVIVTTDRQSAFDRLLASIPFKGQVRRLWFGLKSVTLTQLSGPQPTSW
jgi:phosphoribosylaminoimidazole-succinocarboxamide synthase